MLLKEIYARDIFREINPAVVVSNKNRETIEAEIKEYVFTAELIEKLYEMIDTVMNKKTGKSGIWINGYYGSGKSHFIKYVHYLLDASTSNLAFEAFEKAVKESYDAMAAGNNQDITLSNVKLLRKKIEGSQCDNIMFNVEDETDDGSQERLTRIFLHMFNKFRGYNSNDIPLAILLEKQLDRKGVFEQFKQKVEQETGFHWETDAANAAAFQLDDILDIAKSFIPELDKESLHNKISNPEAYKVGIKATLIPELQEFLKTKDRNYRLLFLVDEVSQYVGRNKEILLNFQNIIERVSDDCNNQVWIACTAQQTLDEVSNDIAGVTDVQDEFGKILGRFDTRISLQSNDASYITQRRVLDKNSNGTEELSNLYSSNKDYIDNQFKINHELYKGYATIDEFIIAYPFVPYQFKLIAHVFEAFQQLGYVIKQVKDNERSILGITHFTAKEHAEDQMGGFMPFDAFYNRSLVTNLTHRGNKAIQNALELPYVQNNAFAQRVVKVLFMVSNLLENQRQTFPSNVENLGVLLMDALDQNKKELQKRILEVLNRLLDESIIREEKGSYFFFNEDEIDVQNLIKSQSLVLDDRYTTFKDLFNPIINVRNKVTYGQSDFKLGYSIEGKEIFRNGDINVNILLLDTTPLEQKALDVNKKDVLVAVNEWFTTDDSLKKDFDWYCRTNKYFLNSAAGGTGERSKTNENFKIRNNQLKDKLIQSFKAKFSNTRFVSQNNIVDPSEITGVVPSDRFAKLLDYHLKGIYKNHELSFGYARTQQELKASVASNQVLMETLEPAEEVVNNFITQNNNQITVYDLIQNFEKEPFGWRWESVLDILVRLEKKKKREFKYKGISRYNRVDFINKAVSTAERTSCEVVSGEVIDQVTLDGVFNAFKNAFNEVLGPDELKTDQNKLFDALKAALTKHEEKYADLESKYRNYAFAQVFTDAKKIIFQYHQITDLNRLFNNIIDDQEVIKEKLDTGKAVNDFAVQRLDKYNEIKSFSRENNDNFKLLESDDKEKVKKINNFFEAIDPRKEFRHIVKAYDEIKEAISSRVADLRDKTVETYQKIFEELAEEASKRKVDEKTYADKEYTINGIKNLTSLSGLKTKFLEASNFKSEQLQKIIEATSAPGETAAESSIYYTSRAASTITTEQELEEYLLKLRREMLQLLKDNKNIIIK